MRVPAWYEPRGVVALVLLYILAHVALRVWLSPVVTIDDAREALFAQTLEWGYQPRQPPLYNWLVWLAFRLLGVGIWPLVLVKYAVLGAAYLCLYLSARRVLGDARLAALGTFSLLLVVPLNWVVHEALTHSLAALAVAALTFYVLLRVEAGGGLGASVGLGLALALGFLAKFSFALFAGSLLLAALSLPSFRASLLRPRMVLGLGGGALVLLPYLVWFYRHDFSLGRMYGEEVDPGLEEPYLLGVASALYYIARIAFYYLTPLSLVVLALFPAIWRDRRARPTAVLTAPRRLVRRFFLAEGAILLAAALFAGLTYLKFRWMIPTLFLLPLMLFSWVDGAEPRSVAWYARVLLVAELLVLVAFAANIYRGDRLGRPSRLTTPYDRIAAQLALTGFRHGTIAAGEGALGGNLRLHFREARVIRLTNPDYLPPPGAPGPCLVAWEKGPGEGVPPEMQRWLAAALGLRLTGREPTRVAQALYHHARERTLRVRFLLLEAPRGGRC
jgi:4-amino-4-deoxy-L-arabinose transferase-like glycosyltransferase